MSDAPQTAPFDPTPRISQELNIALSSVRATAQLLAEGASVPFVARYRKEQTGGLDEVQIRDIDEKRVYYAELDERRRAILGEIESQGKLTPELKKQIETCWVKAELEDLYLPYKPKRRTRAMIARERGLEPLAMRILEQPAAGNPQEEAAAFVHADKEVPDVKTALSGARDIVAEVVAEHPDVRAKVRDVFSTEGVLACAPVPEKTSGPTKFEMYYAFREKVATIPSHRYLAIRRGETEGVLRSEIEVDRPALSTQIAAMMKLSPKSPFAGELQQAVDHALIVHLTPTIETEVRLSLKQAADRDAIQIFAENLRKLLLAAPLGRRVVLGIDPGQRTGCKCVVVDDTGKLLTHTLIQLVHGDAALARAKDTVLGLCKTHKPFAIAVGNGTHGRETADFCRAILSEAGLADILVILVSESGASVYSASDVARDEFPELDLTVRGAISIARRLQDPLAELVKIDPKSIGVGQYQHDVSQPLLKKKLGEVVESCVNAVGVELNTASAPLLSYVAGVGPSLAKRIVKHREERGAFSSRKSILEVSGFGPKTFEQCAGFVRLRGVEHPLDGSAVHPERYPLIEQMAKDLGVELSALVGNAELAGRIPWSKYESAEVGKPTLDDIRSELCKPGRDPRDAFEAPAFRDDVRTLEDLKPGMVLEGVITNVTAFGAFVDIGVHQDGLVHISQLSDKFVKDPHAVAKVGDKLKVKVLEVDLARKRIALTARSDGGGARPSAPASRDREPSQNRGKPSPAPRSDAKFSHNPFAVLGQRRP